MWTINCFRLSQRFFKSFQSAKTLAFLFSQGSCISGCYRESWKGQLSMKQLSRLVTNPTKWVYAQRRLRSVWASAQSDQSLRCRCQSSLSAWRNLGPLATHWCPGWSESLLGAQPHCLFCHEADQLKHAYSSEVEAKITDLYCVF